jgi:hypothetical protein
MAGRFDKARSPYLFRFGYCFTDARGETAAKYCRSGDGNYAQRRSRVGENEETSERLIQTNVSAALNGLGGHSHVRDVDRSGALEAVRWPGSYIFV